MAGVGCIAALMEEVAEGLRAWRDGAEEMTLHWRAGLRTGQPLQLAKQPQTGSTDHHASPRVAAENH